ncbi:hypothetical protein B296_00019284 [Ensete ventricosum]|uniref:Uncharacterized protein n=1 Tax=Ensete ventricosum TaxID=4639 RepID=A0A426ZN25_ENSVE|nr:hypothetical protein B296_00019284 [Ensete ventricosum]
MRHSRGRKLSHDIIEHRIVSIKPWEPGEVEPDRKRRKRALDHRDVPSRAFASCLPRALHPAELVLCVQVEPHRHSRNAPSNHSLHPTARPTAELAALGSCPGLDRDNSRPTKADHRNSRRNEIREKGLLKAPNSIRTQSEEHDHGRYYHFHRDYGHDTDECYDLKNQIEDLICCHLDQFVRKPCKLSLCPKGPMVRQIDVIVGRPVAGGDSSSARKAYARAEVQKRPRARLDPEITFKSENEYPAHIVNAHVKPIMIDTGSSVDILYFDTF